MNITNIVNKNGCSLPWLHAEVNFQSGKILPCCKYTGGEDLIDGFSSVWTGKLFSNLRDDIISDKLHKECSACDVNPNSFSYKKWKNEVYQKQGMLNNLTTDNIDYPKVFHISLSNTCNLACRMCSPGSSSKIVDLIKNNKNLISYFDPVKSTNVDVSKLKGAFKNAVQLTFAGGEPLIDDDCYRLVEMALEESTNLATIVFSTNMTKLNKKLINLLAASKLKIMFNVSLDGPLYIQEYIRHGCKLQEIIDNIKFLKLTSHRFKFGINSTISALNAGYIPELIEQINQLEQECNVKFTHIMATPVLEDKLHAGALPNNVKEFYTSKLKNKELSLCNIPGARSLISTALELMSKDKDTSLFFRFLVDYDLATRTDYKVIYPELS
jgi:hypothetical protein